MNDDVAVVVSNTEQISKLRHFKSIPLEHYKEFIEILKIKYSNNEKEMNDNEDYEFDHILFLGLELWKKEETGYEIIHDGKIADKRVLKKLDKIKKELLAIRTFPKVEGNTISVILNKALGNLVNRTMIKYRKTLLYYCNVDEDIIDKIYDSRLGTLDVSGFVRRIPSNI